MVPARRIGSTVLFIFYNAESAQRENGKQYLKNLLNIHLHLLDFGTYCFVWQLTFVSFRYPVP
jgi:hypothetical protein